MDNEIIANVSNFNQTILGLRYAYQDWTCCGLLDRSDYPCPPNSCAINAGKENRTMPALPFWAQIDQNGDCQCFYPQTCSNSNS